VCEAVCFGCPGTKVKQACLVGAVMHSAALPSTPHFICWARTGVPPVPPCCHPPPPCPPAPAIRPPCPPPLPPPPAHLAVGHHLLLGLALDLRRDGLQLRPPVALHRALEGQEVAAVPGAEPGPQQRLLLRQLLLAQRLGLIRVRGALLALLALLLGVGQGGWGEGRGLGSHEPQG
jgi:hypothetical protein